ncbi:MAG: DUF4430 domain-containing protein [Clostridiales bacterium]|jgi:hypothetical protein|nr:DUF4430 domain-containing protein [Clostridiales bacterium]
MNKKKNKIVTVTLAAFLVVLIAGFTAVYFHFHTGSAEGTKRIEIQIVFSDSQKKTVEIKTNSKFLREALEEKKLIEGTESANGIFIETVEGVVADADKQQWWCITKGGEPVMTGVDSTPIADKDKFEITLKTGYDF